jgi:hypothetical protein
LFISGKKIDANKCRSTNLYDSNGPKNNSFYELLLSDTFSNTIYISIIEPDSPIFDSRTHDFQRMVGDNGYDADQDVTPIISI